MKKIVLFTLVLFALYSCTNKQQENKQELTDTLTHSKVKPTDSDELSLKDSIAATGRQALVFLKEKNYAMKTVLTALFCPNNYLVF